MALNCVTSHTAMVHDRGGVRRLYDLTNIGRVEWGRSLDDKSRGSITISTKHCIGQMSTLHSVRAKRHELVVFRGTTRVWEGPIDEVSWKSTGMVITAFDIKHYLDYTPLTKSWPNEDGGGPPYMTQRAQQIIQYELNEPYDADVMIGGAPAVIEIPRWENLDPPINVLPYLDVRHGTVLTRVSTEPFQMTLGEHLDRMAESGMDYTAIGRKLLLWDSADSISRIRTLTEADFSGELDIYETGADHADVLHVTGTAQADSEGGGESDEVLVVGTDGGADPYYGVWTIVASSQSEEGADGITQDALISQAYRQRLWRREVPVEIRVPSGVSLIMRQGLDINALVPGAEVPVRATWNGRDVQQVQRITELKVVEDGGGEQITLTMVPSGPAYEDG